MASYTIPEEVIGVPLFVPDAHDFFEIASGAMPNGDDCLRIRGDISADYKAFQPAPSTSPNIAENLTVWAMTFWINCPSANVGSAMFICLENQNSTGFGSASGLLWHISTATTSPNTTGLRARRGTSGTGGQYFEAYASGVRDGTWHLVTVNFAAASNPGTIWLDDAATAAATATQGAGGSLASNYFLCIGGYGGSNRGVPLDYKLGKLAFHDHQLNATERALLYNAMMNP